MINFNNIKYSNNLLLFHEILKSKDSYFFSSKHFYSNLLYKNINKNNNNSNNENEPSEEGVNFQSESLGIEESTNNEESNNEIQPGSNALPDDSFNGSTLIINSTPGTRTPMLGLSQSLSNQEEVDPIAGSLPTVISTGFSNDVSIATAIGQTENDISQETIQGNGSDEKDKIQITVNDSNNNGTGEERLIKVEKDPSPTPPLQHSLKNDIQIVSTTHPTASGQTQIGRAHV